MIIALELITAPVMQGKLAQLPWAAVTQIIS